ncbi:hypothetical protein Pcinc_033468 [Petrolisthes cinctipes]|uniref:Uncharacterized protein n=1 Tax=Petrolisthes cinctipes TaxID=88211 RepID=A0AAE1ESD1_PETCI|nr:hypothetical protein Pcinc_033468 [Petrolisthes cinctipes]
MIGTRSFIRAIDFGRAEAAWERREAGSLLPSSDGSLPPYLPHHTTLLLPHHPVGCHRCHPLHNKPVESQVSQTSTDLYCFTHFHLGREF